MEFKCQEFKSNNKGPKKEDISVLLFPNGDLTEKTRHRAVTSGSYIT